MIISIIFYYGCAWDMISPSQNFGLWILARFPFDHLITNFSCELFQIHYRFMTALFLLSLLNWRQSCVPPPSFLLS